MKCLTQYDVRGFNLLGSDGMPYVTIEALRRNLDQDPEFIDVTINRDQDGQERDSSPKVLGEIKAEVEESVEDLRTIVGELPLAFYKEDSSGQRSPVDDWLS
ncbi:hypothetical protein LOC72_04665 [Roseiconus lacunae]|nr:hypothetical protein [Roseiconus lacunae]